jgi:hypothetical protein
MIRVALLVGLGSGRVALSGGAAASARSGRDTLSALRENLR